MPACGARSSIAVNYGGYAFAGFLLAALGVAPVADAQVPTPKNRNYSPVPGHVRPAGLWDKPNEACMIKCQTYVDKGCFKQLSEKSPDADPASIQEQCEAKFSLCLYDCMCDTCDENQIVIRP